MTSQGRVTELSSFTISVLLLNSMIGRSVDIKCRRCKKALNIGNNVQIEFNPPFGQKRIFIRTLRQSKNTSKKTVKYTVKFTCRDE